ncbi:MAG: hypothetical protein M3451_04960 [Chloroflexota bacterium]|nr:hypothetical protein [Chloroflexota bacterium]
MPTKNALMRKLFAAVLATLGMAVFTVVGATPAQAAYGCNGTLLQTYTVHPLSGSWVTYVDVYLENGTTNCLVNRTGGASYNQANGMGIVVSKTAANVPAADSGSTICSGMTTATGRVGDCSASYRLYAGPVRIYAPGSCIHFTARAAFAVGTAAEKFVNKHCG